MCIQYKCGPGPAAISCHGLSAGTARDTRTGEPVATARRARRGDWVTRRAASSAGENCLPLRPEAIAKPCRTHLLCERRPARGETRMATSRTEREPGPVPTIYDVARECGVSPSTVSRAFSRPGRVSPLTAERIKATAERLGYRTNPIARALVAA